MESARYALYNHGTMRGVHFIDGADGCGGELMADFDHDDRIYVGKSVKPEYLMLRYGNRHGLVTGATGTGKMGTLQVPAESFSCVLR